MRTSGRYFEVELDGSVAFRAATYLSPPLAGSRRPWDDHQVPIEMLQDLDLRPLRIPPQQRIQPFQFGHDPRGVYPRRGDGRRLLDGRPFSPESFALRLDRSQLSPNGW